MSDEIESLIDRWLYAPLSESEESRLQAWLKREPDHMRRFVEVNVRDQMLREVARSEFMAEHVREQFAARRIARPLSIRSAMFAAVAASAALAVFLIWPDAPSGVTVEIVSIVDAEYSKPSISFAKGERLLIQRFRLEAGSVEMLLASGVRVEFSSPVEAEFESDMRLRLLEGRISADVGAQGKGFTVATDAGEVIDLGTRFGVEADRNGESRVAVFSGAVEVHPRDPASSGKILTLTEGEALRFSARAGLRRWQQVALEADRAGLSDATNVGVIRAVHDNLGDEALRPFYGVVRHGMKSGALAFTDKPNPVWMPSPGQEFPKRLEGADLVRTYYHFRNIKDYELTLTLAEPADVFVLLVTPGETPGWLLKQFEPTGIQLRSGPWHPGIAAHPAAAVEPDGAFLNFAVWKREAGPGDLILGPPRNNKLPGVPSLMYGLAVKARSSH